MNAVILCGGKGTRLSSISRNRPKILLKIVDTYFIYLLFDSLINQGIKKIFLLTSYKSEMIKKKVGYKYRNTEITYLDDAKELSPGTASALVNSIEFLPEHFILQYGDTILDLNYKDFYFRSLENQEQMLMSVYKNELNLDKNNVLIEGNYLRYFNSENTKSKKVKEITSHIDYGLIGIHKSFLMDNLEKLKENASLKHFQEKLSFLNLIKPYFCLKRFYEIGNLESYAQFIEIYKRGDLDRLIIPNY